MHASATQLPFEATDPDVRSIQGTRAGSSTRRATLVLALAGCATHASLVWLTVTRRLDFLFNDAHHRLGPGTDLAAYRDAGLAWLSSKSIFAAATGFGYRYHPFLAMTVGAALARLSFPAALAVWVSVHELLIVADAAILWRLLPPSRRALGVSLLLVLFSPLYLELYMGNASFVAASLMLLAWQCDRSRFRIAFTVLFAISILVKPLGLVLLPWFAVQRRWRELLAILAIVGIAALPYFGRFPADLGALFTANTAGRAPGWLVHAGNQGLHGFFGALLTRTGGVPTWRLASYDQLGMASRLVLGAIPWALALLSWRGSWLTRDRREVGVFLWSCVYLLGFHDIWEHSYSMLVLGLGLLWAIDFVPRGILLACTVGLALPTGFAFYDLHLPAGPYDPEHGWTTAVSLLHHATKPAWLLALYVTTLVSAERRARRNGVLNVHARA